MPVLSALKEPLKRPLQYPIKNKMYSGPYNVKANPAVVSLPHFKNELKYNPVDYREWTLTSGVTADETGITMITNGTWLNASLNTTLKPSTKYGLLLNVISQNLSYTFAFTDTPTNAFSSQTVSKNVGCSKTVVISNASITVNSLKFRVRYDEPLGRSIKISKPMLYELPVGSEIESDFTTKTANELMIKYAPTNFIAGDLKPVVLGRTLKNELNYTPSTWAEWIVNGATVDSTGITLTAVNGSTVSAYANTVLKPNTKYGALFNIASLSGTDGNFGVGSASRAFPAITLARVTGNVKTTGTTSSSITNNSFIFWMDSSNTTGNIVKINDIRLYELPTGSEIESDFINKSADELALKYPMAIDETGKTGSVMSVGSKVATNLVSNGDFRYGTTGWSAGGGVGCAVSALNNILRVIPSGTTYNFGYAVQTMNFVIGRTYYYRAKLVADQAGASSMSIYTDTGNAIGVTNPVQGFVYKPSKIFTYTGALNQVRAYLYYDTKENIVGKTMSIQEYIAIDLTATFGAGKEPNLATCDRVFADYFNGSKSITQLRSVGKNLVDKSKFTDNAYIQKDAGTVSNGALTLFCSDYTPVIGGSVIFMDSGATSSTTGHAFYDTNKSFISSVISNNDGAISVPANARYFRASFYKSVWTFDTAMVNYGSILLPYEPYTQQVVPIPEPLHSIGTVQDSFDVSTGVLTKRISDVYTVQSDDIYRVNTAYTTLDYVYIRLPSDIYKRSPITSFINCFSWPTGISTWDDVININKVKIGDSYQGIVQVGIAKGTSIYDAKIALAGKQLIYQLANPTTKKYDQPIDLKAVNGGALYIEKVTGDYADVVPNLQIQYERSV